MIKSQRFGGCKAPFSSVWQKHRALRTNQKGIWNISDVYAFPCDKLADFGVSVYTPRTNMCQYKLCSGSQIDAIERTVLRYYTVDSVYNVFDGALYKCLEQAVLKVKLALYLINEVRSPSHLGRFIPGERASGTHWIGGWVDPTTGLDAVEKRRISFPCQESKPGRRARSSSLYRLTYPDNPMDETSVVFNRVSCIELLQAVVYRL
jgi:hypothetical protein